MQSAIDEQPPEIRTRLARIRLKAARRAGVAVYPHDLIRQAELPTGRGRPAARYEAYSALRDTGMHPTDARRETGISGSTGDRYERAYKKARNLRPGSGGIELRRWTH